MSTKINNLVADLKLYNQAYRLGKPLISDTHYDNLVAELYTLDPDNDWFKSIEPVDISVSRKKKLPIPMKSLNKVKCLSDIQQWLKSLAIPDSAFLVLTPKFDGVSWLHDEKTGETYSRGGSENEGQNCNAHYLKGNFNQRDDWNIPSPPRYTFGELVFRCEKWKEHFEGTVSDATGEKYRSPRNTIAGFINREEPSDLIDKADFFRYGVSESDLENFSSYTELLSILCRVFKQPPLWYAVQVKDITEDLLFNLFIQWRQQFYIDGLVIYLDDLVLWKHIGRQQTSGNPLYAIAYKHPDFTEAFETTVKGITWKVSKSGALKPVVNINAVDTGDCTMENPTGYNARFCRDNKIGIGAKILVTRSGGVIPKILEVLSPGYDQTPTSCHYCGHEVSFDEKGIELYCTNSDCWGRRLAKIIHFLNTVGIEGVGEETITKIFIAGFETVKSFLDLTWDDLAPIDGFGESIINNILSQMKKIKDGVDLPTLMHASDCFKGIGKIKAQKIISDMEDDDLCAFCQGWYYSVWQFENWPNHPSFQELSITKQNLFLGYRPFWSFMEEVKIPILFPKQTELKGNRYAEFNVCFSGIRDKELENEIMCQGGKIANGVSKTTTHLVVKDPNGASTKISKAKQFNIPILSIDQFKSL